MKRFILLTLFASPSYAAPFLVTDPIDPNADVCVVTINGVTQTVPPVVEGGQKICKVDLAGAQGGQNDVSLKVRNNLWGVESAAAPFAFTKPASIAAPSTIRLVP